MMISMKLGDRPLLESVLTDGDGNPANLTGATVRLKAVNTETEAVEVDTVASIHSNTGGVVRYQVMASEFDTVGLYQMEWEVTFPTGIVLTFPSEEFDYVKVSAGL
jgi:hypothetical protein